MTSENEQKVKQIVKSIRRLYRAVYLDYSKGSRVNGLTGSQGGVLRILLNNGSLSSADLSRKLYVKPSNITGIIDRLEKKSLVKRVRKEGDRRVALITLTETGTILSKSIPDPIEKKLVSGLGHMGEDDVEQISRIMTQILNLVDASEISCAPLEITTENDTLLH